MSSFDPGKILIAPSILAADFSRLGDQVAAVESAGADWVHCDVMDGHFVDNISFGPALVQAVSKVTKLPLDVHLMVERPDHFVPRFSGFARSISVHVEARHDVLTTLRAIRAGGLLAGLALNPATPLDHAAPFFGEFDILLIMTVVPGFGGQPFMPEMLEKARSASALGLPMHIEVDGGVNVRTASLSREAGANVLVAGTSVFGAADPCAEIAALRGR